jgi:hypothetical protein
LKLFKITSILEFWNLLFRFLAKLILPVNLFLKSLELQLRGTCVRGVLFGEVSAEKKEKKKAGISFCWNGRGEAGRGGQRQKGSKREGEGRGARAFENASCAICFTICCCSLLLWQQTRTKKTQKQKNKAPPRTAQR